jgi:hypothetical protein
MLQLLTRLRAATTGLALAAQRQGCPQPSPHDRHRLQPLRLPLNKASREVIPQTASSKATTERDAPVAACRSSVGPPINRVGRLQFVTFGIDTRMRIMCRRAG